MIDFHLTMTFDWYIQTKSISCQNRTFVIYVFFLTQYFKGKWILKLKIALGGRETIAEGEGTILAQLDICNDLGFFELLNISWFGNRK